MQVRTKLFYKVVLLTFIWKYASGDASQDVPDFPEVQRLNEKLTEKVREIGFELEIHDVYTEDDYILQVHRLVVNSDQPRPPVLIMHGISGCSVSFLVIPNSVAFYLAKHGYDVWVGNARGTAYSRKKNKTYHDREFWNFSWHEIGEYDLPALLAHIRKTTGAQRVHYVGLSMGTTVFLVMISEKPKLLDSMGSVTLLAPVARPQHFKSISSKRNRVLFNWVLTVLEGIGHGNFWKYRRSISDAVYRICKSKKWYGQKCQDYFRSQSGGVDLFDFENAKETYTFFPCGASVKSFKHYIQLADSGKFQKYDYGRRKNKIVYNSDTPPEYELGSGDWKISLVVGGEDTEADKRDVEWLHKKIPRSLIITENFENFDHRDFEQSTELETVGKTVKNIITEYETIFREIPVTSEFSEDYSVN